jgi:hypothetical protein
LDSEVAKQFCFWEDQDYNGQWQRRSKFK